MTTLSKGQPCRTPQHAIEQTRVLGLPSAGTCCVNLLHAACGCALKEGNTSNESYPWVSLFIILRRGTLDEHIHVKSALLDLMVCS